MNTESPGLCRAVLITGCDTGFGSCLVPLLASRGFRVFAGCLTEDAVKRYDGTKNIVPFVFDVTNQEHMDNCVALLEKELGNSGLWALVNNAGISRGSFMDWTSETELRQTMEVNFFAPTILSKRVLHLLYKYTLSPPTGAQGPPRIINITSLSARVPAPQMGCYTASKHALRAMSDVMRWEFAANGVAVSQVEPTFHATPMVTGADTEPVRLFLRLPKHVQEIYGGVDRLIEFLRRARARISGVTHTPERVVAVLRELCETPNPPPRRTLVWDWQTWGLFRLYELLPTAITDFLARWLPSLWPRRGLVPPVGALADVPT